METLLTTLTAAVEGSAWVAAGGAFLWGVLSIVLSPCHLSSIPLVVAFVSEQGTATTRRAFTVASVFALGVLATIGIVGAITAALGRMLGDIGLYGNYLVAGIFVVLGLHFLGVIPLPWSGPGPSGGRRRGLLAALGLGFVFGLGVGPCTFAYMAPMLAVTFKVAAHSWLYGVVLLLLYGLGHCSLIVAAGTSATWVQRYLNWTARSQGTQVVRRACGVLVILAGLYLIYRTP